ncbi:ribonuclease T2-like isoform X2 [Nerophis ophidion]|uniref:ribonuclease T2-like isoform X2 n=1 Tax=Nerophis ophidion TaxID=159077 RepID=UPI002AE0446B|nr:ribonuclease T2-like isoform X2 [Nerophis ophidion]
MKKKSEYSLDIFYFPFFPQKCSHCKPTQRSVHQRQISEPMKMFCALLPLLVCLSPAALLSDVTAAREDHVEDYKHGRPYEELSNKTQCSWKCLIFALQWPGGFCQSLDNVSQCKIPSTVNTWLIHGLWPMRTLRCCNCWPFFMSDIQDVENLLEEYWPSLVKNRSNFHFWRDEWEKHGVCAACVEGLNSPLRYFQTSLKLGQHFDLQKALDDGGIKPSCDRPYKVSEVLNVLVPLIGDKCEIQCVTDEKDREVWFQLKIYLSRNMTLGCDQHDDNTGVLPMPKGHPCPYDESFYFFPIDHQRPLQPCG